MSNLTTFPSAPLPSDKELRARRNVVRQAWRFVVLNGKMLTMVTKGHH